MVRRQTPASPSSSPDRLHEKIDGLVTLIEKQHQQIDETLGAMTEKVEDLADQVRILRIAIDDIRCELEFTMRNHAPRRDPAINVPVVSMSKVGKTSSAGSLRSPDELAELKPPAESCRLFE